MYWWRMKLYHLRLAPQLHNWGCCLEAVVAAEDEAQARSIMAGNNNDGRRNYGQEDAEAWLDPSTSTCRLIADETPLAREVVVSSFAE